MKFTVSTTFNGMREVCVSNQPDYGRSLIFGAQFRTNSAPTPLTLGQALDVAFGAITSGGKKTRIHLHKPQNALQAV